MDWKLSDEQDAYQKTLRAWLADVAPTSTVRQWLAAEDDQDFESRFVAAGWAGVGLPEDLGGQGGGLVELSLTAEEMARSAVPSAAWLATVLAAPALAGRSDLVVSALAGENLALLVPAESVPDSSPPLWADEDGAITGRVPRVLGGDRATRFIVPVGDRETLQLRLVEADAPGAGLGVRPLLDRTRSVADITLDRVPSTYLDVDATAVLTEASAQAAVLTAADSLGTTERMLDLAVEYSLQRRQFGVPIGSFQAVKHAAAALLVGIEAARSAVYFAAASVDGGDPESMLHAAAVKAQVTAEGARGADSALTLHGAIGYTWEHDLHLFYKRAKLDEKLFGAPTVWNERIADRLTLV